MHVDDGGPIDGDACPLGGRPVGLVRIYLAFSAGAKRCGAPNVLTTSRVTIEKNFLERVWNRPGAGASLERLWISLVWVRVGTRGESVNGRIGRQVLLQDEDYSPRHSISELVEGRGKVSTNSIDAK